MVILDPIRQRSKQYAFVVYRDSESATRALMDQIMINGRICEVYNHDRISMLSMFLSCCPCWVFWTDHPCRE